MSFSDNYYALLEEEKKRKKKKATEQKTGHSFTDTYNELMAEADIAPTVNTTTDAPLFTQRTAPFFERGVSLPVKTTVTKGEEEKDLVFFQKGAFEDGWDKGDLWKTILGTGADAIVGLGKGVSKLVEGVVDVGSYGVAGIADAFDSEEYADKVRKKAQKNAVDDYFADVDAFYDQYSVLGKTSDAIAEALGQVGGIILTGGLGAAAGLGAAGVTALTTTTMGLSSFGSGMGEAYAGGASDKEAATYGLIKGVVDAGSELIFGGLGKTVKALGLSRGLSSLDDMFARKLSSKLTNQVAKNFVEYGVKATAEGVEEVLAGLGSAIGKKLTYMSDEELNKLVKDENLLEQFVVGTVVSGFAQGGDLNASNKSNRDFVSGLSQNEQKVVDYEVQKRTDGQKLTNKQKNSIYDAVFRDMERGRISTDTIEEVLGGETYKTYKDTVYSEDALRQEYEELGKKQNATLAEQTRYNELHQQVNDLKTNSQRDAIREQLGTEVMSLVQGSRLAESYNERSRRGQAFEADISKYDAKMQATIQKAIDSGILNNTNRTHEFVELVAKITADKGVLFDFTNNERLKESGFAVDGAAVNGYLTKDGVTLNIDSAKSMNSVVGHEITHVLEGADLYYELQNAVTSYAKAKGDYRGRYNALVKLYEGVEGADIKAELTADLVGDYLFSDVDFVRNLSVTNRNVFQKIYDEIKYLYKVATAGSKEARELEKVKRVFEQAYKEGGKAQGETKYSLADAKVPTLEELKQKAPVAVVDISTPQTKGTFAERRKQILANASEVISKPYLNKDTGAMIFLTEKSYTHAFNNLGEIQLNAAEHLPELIENAVLTHGEKATHGSDYASGVYTFFAAAKADGVRPVKLKVKEYTYAGQDLPKNIKAYFDSLPQGYAASYDTVVLEVEEIEKSPSGSAKDMNQNGSFLSPDELSTIKVTDLINLVKGDAEKYIPKYSLGYHAGDLGKAEGYWNMVSSKRDTGHFGTGTYFVGDEAQINDSHYGNRPHEKVEFSNYKLFKPLYEDEGFKLHDSLRYINSNISLYPIASMSFDEAYDIRKAADDAEYTLWDDDATEAEKAEAHKTLDDLKERFESIGYDPDSWDAERLYEELRDIRADYRDAKSKLAMIFGRSSDVGYLSHDAAEARIDDLLKSVYSEVSQIKDAYAARYEDSPSTRFMKALGYEGIDVRGFKGLDNTRYGSVIYDLKGEDAKRKAEIGTAKYSLSDSDSKQLSKEQQDYFKDSKIRDANGNLMVMYHGTKKGGYTVFQNERRPNTEGFYFTNDKKYSYTFEGRKANGQLYPSTKEGIEAGYYNPQRYKVYLDVKNPLVLTADQQDIIEDIGYWEHIYKPIKAAGYDGVMMEDMSQVFVFNSNQIKRVDNAKPTADKDIRYSLSEDSEGRELSDEQKKYFEHSKVVDDNGNLKVVYHGSPADFNIFSLDYLGTNGTAEGYGFYFTDKKSIAENYSKGREGQQNGEVGKLFEVYLDIKKPLSDTEVTMTRAQFKKFLTTLNKQVDADGEPLDILSNYGDVAWEGLNNVLNYAMEVEYDGSDSDVNLVHSIINGCGNLEIVLDVLRKTTGYDGIIVEDATWGDDQKIYLAFHPEQIKNVDNLNPTSNPDIRRSLSSVGEQFAPVSGRETFGKDITLETAPAEEVAPVQEETVAENATVDENLFPDDVAPVEQELERLEREREALEAKWETMGEDDDFSEVQARWQDVVQRIEELETEAGEAETSRLNSLDDVDAPMEQEAPYSEGQPATVDDPFEDRDYADVGQRSVKAYMYENPEVKPFFQAEAEGMLGDLRNSLKGQKWFNDEVYYATGGEHGWGGTKRHTTDDIAYLLDGGYTYAQIEKGLNAIIEDNGAENNAVSKRIEFALNDRLLNGFRDLEGRPIPPNEEYIRLLQEKQITEYSKEAFDAFMENADSYAPPAEEDIAPVVKPAKSVAMDAPVAVKSEAIRPKKQTAQPRMAKATPAEQASAQVLTEEPKVDKKKPKIGAILKDNLIDRGTIFETLSLKTGNRELQAKFKSIGRAESSAQWFMEHGNASTNSLKTIRDTVEQSGKTQAFYEYLYHRHNVDRMNLEGRYPDMENKPVFGYGVTSEISKAEAEKLEKVNPEFKQWANSVYSYMTELREMMVDNGVISRKTANLWAEMYPHYVPIRRKGDDGLNINVALDTKRTGINAPIKKATGGNRDILPLFDTMAMRTEQTFRAVARNSFGVELKNMLGSTIEKGDVSVDEAIDSVETELLKEGKDGGNPTFTVFEDGKRVTFEITEEMYDTMQPKSKFNSYTNKVLNKANDIRRGLLTEYNPAFMLTNPIKDTQDVMINSQHPARTYANYPKAIAELWGKKGQYYQEYMEHGGEQNTYFDGETKTFAAEKSGLSKVIGFPFEKISQANNFIERIPRMAEYIASRKMGRSIDVAMLDAARVTTDFSAGGDFVRTLNRNGFTFLNASVQGAVQQVRNVREAKAEGLKGVVKLATKVAVAGLPAVLLNHLLWDDDEDYAELSDYVKQNYYVVAKYGDGKFVRIPKGRALAVIQNAFEEMGSLLTGNDAADYDTFASMVISKLSSVGGLAISNLAPNNPLENNLIAPIMQAKNNTTWYGEDLVPTRLQDLPAAEQFDETTDALSKWLGEKTNISPYKLNYVLDQYSGALGDMFLPMMTPEAERGNDSAWGNLIAPLSDKFTTDGVMKNQNVSDFYTKKDELTVKANASGATDEDVLMNKYMSSVNADLAKLYAAKRELQNSDMPNAEKYEAVRDVQKQIVELTKEALGSYDDISFEDDYREGGEYARVSGKLYKLNEEGEWSKLSDEQVTKYEVTKAAGNASYASDGTNHYRWYEPGEDADKDAEPGWRKVTEKELERQKEVTSGLGISPSEYWNSRDEYGYAYDNPENYAVAKAVGGYEAYKGYSGELYDIKADKDENGKSISGSRKEKVLDYINNLDADYYTKIILWKSEYPSDDSNNYEIIEYLNGREDISFEETISILRKLGFDVTDDGDISW